MNQEQTKPGGVQAGVTEQNEARITALFQEHREALERYLRSLLKGSEEEAKELAQEAYMRLLKQRKRREVGDWEGLLWCAARNLAFNRIEQRKARQAACVLLQIETEDHQTPEKSCGEQQTIAEVQQAIEELPRRMRIVLTRNLEGQSYARIARELGVDERTCRRDYELAIVEIRRKVGPR